MSRTRERFWNGRLTMLAGVWLVLVVAAVVVGLGRYESDLTSRGDASLASAGLSSVSIAVEGRDVVLTGAPENRAGAEAAIGTVTGVRTVRWLDTAPVGVREAPDPGQTAGTTSTTTTTSTSIFIEPGPPEPGAAFLSATLEDGRVVIEGTLPDAAIAERVAYVADLIYAPFLDNRLVVDASVPPASWVPNTAQIVSVLPIVGSSSITVSGEAATLSGLAPTEARRDTLVGAMAAALGPEVALDTSITVTGLAPPWVQVGAPGDGTLRLEGIMPDESVVQLIEGTAAKVFGPENVVSSLEVGDGIDTTFSLFRLPLTFPLFQPVPQWTVRIDDDRISGNLRGGATFPVGSSQLTPELEHLLPVAAGILSRNPTLVMTVEGHSDAIGSDEANQVLSERRAQAAVDWLIAAGIDSRRLFAVGYGETRPIGDNTTQEGRALNRRVEFRLGPPEQQGGA